MLAILVIELLGYGLISLIDGPERRRRPRSLLERCALSWPLGTLVLTLLLFLLGCLPIGVSAGPVLLVALLGLGASAWRLRHRGSGVTSIETGSADDAYPGAHIVTGRTVGLLLAALVAAVAIATVARPIAEWDAISIWSLRAKELFHERHLLAPAFLHPPAPSPHADYPLLLSLVETWGYLLIGGVNDWAAKWLFVPYILVFATLLYAFAREHGGPRFALLVSFVGSALPAAVVPAAAGSLQSAYADYPLTVAMTGAAVCLYRATCTGPRPEPRPNRDLGLAVCFVAAAAWTKNEGALFLLLFVLVLAASCVLRLIKPLSAAIAACGACGLAAPQWIYRHALPPIPADFHISDLRMGVLVSHAARVPFLARAFAAELLNPSHWLLLGPTILLLAPRLFARRAERSRIGPEFALVLLVIGHFLGCFLVYWASPEDPAWLVATSMRRLALQASGPTVVLVTALAAGRAAPRGDAPA